MQKFKLRRQKVLEAEVMKVVKDILKIAEIRRKAVFFRNNVGNIITKDGRYFKTGSAGFGDFVGGIYSKKIGKLLYAEIECKGTGGKQSPAQKEHQKQIENLGGIYYLVTPDNLNQLLGWITEQQ